MLDQNLSKASVKDVLDYLDHLPNAISGSTIPNACRQNLRCIFFDTEPAEHVLGSL